MPPKVERVRLQQVLQLSPDDGLCHHPPDLSELTYKAWEFILINLGDCYAICKGACNSHVSPVWHPHMSSDIVLEVVLRSRALTSWSHARCRSARLSSCSGFVSNVLNFTIRDAECELAFFCPSVFVLPYRIDSQICPAGRP